jgi:site-specific DNA-methyltransferase (adenine-specific)
MSGESNNKQSSEARLDLAAPLASASVSNHPGRVRAKKIEAELERLMEQRGDTRGQSLHEKESPVKRNANRQDSLFGAQAGPRLKGTKQTSMRHTARPGRLGPFQVDKVHHADCIDAMRQLPDLSADIAIADPPYNASKGNTWKWDNSAPLPGFGGNWSKIMADWDDMPLADYFTFTLAWLSELKRIVRPTGSIWIHGTYHNIGIINFALQMLSIEIINEVVWFKRNSFPNLSGRRLTASHETILWAHTGGEKGRRYHFDYEASKAMSSPEDRLKESGKQMRTVWDIPNNKTRDELACGRHPTQKPVRLLKRMLEISAQQGDLLLVPFAGSASDCVAAQALGINFLAFETDTGFVQICNQRLANLGETFALESETR